MLEQALAHPHCAVIGTGAQPVPNTQNFFVPWTAGESNEAGMWVSGDTVTVPVDGVYFLGASATWSANAAGIRVVQIFVGGAMRIESRLPSGVAGNLLTQCPATAAYVSAGTGIRVMVFQSSGGPLNLDPGVPRRLTVTKWGP